MSKKKKKRKEERRQLDMQAQSRHPPVTIRLKYDAAQTTSENARHWSMADGLSIDGSLTPEIRRTLRNRARYEVANNSYARGLTLTLADICIGTGPRLQLLTEDEEFNSRVEWEFAAWCESIRLCERLHTLRVSKISDGEAFAAIVKNPKVRHPVEIDIRSCETPKHFERILRLIAIGRKIGSSTAVQTAARRERCCIRFWRAPTDTV